MTAKPESMTAPSSARPENPPRLAVPPAAEIVLLPTERFMVRMVALDPMAPTAAQVDLALEGFAPFPLTQMFYGYRLAPARDRALIFAAYRKRFSAAESQDWAGAVVVLPAFLALLGNGPKTAAVRVWTDGAQVTALGWNGRDVLPVAVLSRETTAPVSAEFRAALVAEVRTRAGLADVPVQEFAGPVGASYSAAKETATLEARGGVNGSTLTLSRAELDVADVRDKDFLVGQRHELKRDLRLWRAFQFCVGGLAAALVLELGMIGAGFQLLKLKDTVQQLAPAVQKIETAQALTIRIGEMSQRRLKPFEMLSVVNQNRPASIQFIRATTTGLNSLEIEAQTGNAPDVGQYEAVLRTAKELSAVEMRDLRSREGITAFTLSVTFKPEALHEGGGS